MKKLGQLFCDDSAKQIIAMLLTEAQDAGVKLANPVQVHAIETIAGGYQLNTSQGEQTCASLVIATGGLSIPKIGATPFGYQVAKQFGLNIIPPRPALVPLVFDGALRSAVRR